MRLRRRKVPYVSQMEITDCGAACLAMTLGYFGRQVSLDELRQATGTGRDGVNAYAIAEAARRYGLEARGVRVELEELELLPPASILHWEFDHFVVFEGLARDGVRVIDPGIGRDKVAREKFSRSFTGVAITFEPGEGFTRDGAEASRAGASIWRFLAPILQQRRALGAVIVASVLIQLLALAVPLLTGALIDYVLPAADRSLLAALTGGLLGVAGFQVLTTLIRSRRKRLIKTASASSLGRRYGRPDTSLKGIRLTWAQRPRSRRASSLACSTESFTPRRSTVWFITGNPASAKRRSARSDCGVSSFG